MKLVGFENWINVIFAILDNISFIMVGVNIVIQLTTNKILIQCLSFTHKKYGNIYTTNIIDVVTIPASWLIGM